jgi:antitoxin component YwqK of YwqJK toxin-antitoxin module
MPATPARPAMVPAEAVWEDGIAEWVAGTRDPQGRREGPTRSWRGDGTPAGACAYRDGVLHGPWRRFHPDGSLAREMSFVDGKPHGRLTAYGHDKPTPEPLQSCCVPPGAWQMQIDYVDGAGSGQRWYDRAGVHILPSGNPYPPRPAEVPAEAFYEEETERWVATAHLPGGEAHGIWRRWSTAGVLRDRDEYRAGRPHGLWQRFDEAGALAEESAWRDGARDGAHRRLGLLPGFYADERIVEERGAFTRDLAVSVWSLHGRDGQVLRSFDLGPAPDDEALAASPALGPPRARAAWEAEAEALEAGGRLTEAILAAARAAAAAGAADPLRLLLARRTPALTPGGAADLATHTVSRADGKLSVLANALVRGGEPAALLRALATALAGADRAALDLVDAALLLQPDRHDCHVTRALIDVQLGRPAAARTDAAALPAGWEEQRAFLETYARIIFPEFGFWPRAVDITTSFPEVPAGPDRPLDDVRALAQKYATRLGVVRAALLARADPGAVPDWLPPDLGALLPDGPLPLESWDFEEVVVDEQGVEGAPAMVAVDERLVLPDGLSIPALMRAARREWNALCWLCWSAGLDRVALPEALAPPADFGRAATMSVERVWRCRDKLATAGLRAMTRGVPGFVWEGIEIDLLPAVLADIVTEEHVELRALFYWLCDQGIQSPWQDNLRKED